MKSVCAVSMAQKIVQRENRRESGYIAMLVPPPFFLLRIRACTANATQYSPKRKSVSGNMTFFHIASTVE